MEKDKLHSRLTALDGLRGFAIILVFLNHIPTSFLQNILPRWAFGWIYSNGVTGVTFLFILSGFLMSTIYPNPQSAKEFLQKRYTRIFPLFLTMCAVMFVGGLSNTKSPVVFLSILFGFALVTYFFWVGIVKRLPKWFGTTLFILFLMLQLVTAIGYIFWINKESFAYFSSLPTLIHQGFIFLVNATLTLPLGQYVPMLDGVYWTLVAEVLFYILYPTVVVPLAKSFSKKPLKVKIIFLLCLIPFFGGIHMLSYKIFVISLIQPALFFYFATGVFLGYIYRNHTIHFEIFSKKIFKGMYSILPFILFFTTIAIINDFSFLGQTLSPWMRMIFAIPLTFFTAILLDKNTLFSKIFSSKALVYVGTVSYSIYLSHSLTIHIAELIRLPHSTLENFLYVFVVFIVNVGIASILFLLLEKPYFQKRPDEKKEIKQDVKKHISGKIVITIVSIVYIFGVFAAYQSQNSYNFFSLSRKIRVSNLLPTKLDTNHSLSIQFVPEYNNLGLIAITAKHNLNPRVLAQVLQFDLYEKGNLITSSLYNLDEFNKGLEFPFGFPVVEKAKGNLFEARFSLKNNDSTDTVTIAPSTAQAIYLLNKKELATSPMLLTQFVEEKITNIMKNPEAIIAILLVFPFVLLIFI